MDLFSRRIIGWAMSSRMTKDLVISAFEKACTIQVPRRGLIHHCDYKTRNEAMFSILEYILTFYNSKRIHSTLNYMSPMEFEKKYA